MLNYITATTYPDGRDILINLDHIISMRTHVSDAYTELIDRNGQVIKLETPLVNIATTIKLVQVAQLSQNDRKD